MFFYVCCDHLSFEYPRLEDALRAYEMTPYATRRDIFMVHDLPLIVDGKHIRTYELIKTTHPDMAESEAEEGE